MLNNALLKNELKYQLLQGDTINLPLKDNVLDCVLMLGGSPYKPKKFAI